MLKHILLASVFLAGAAHAADTRPMLAAIKECATPSHHTVEAKVGFIVAADGTLADLHVIDSSGDADIDERIVKCVSGYTFKPATHNGMPVAAPDTFLFRQARVEDLSGDRYAFAKLERDADYRCHKLFPIDRNALSGNKISLVGVHRAENGPYQLAILQSAGEKADKQALACLKTILASHEELPASFTRGISVDWGHR